MWKAIRDLLTRAGEAVGVEVPELPDPGAVSETVTGAVEELGGQVGQVTGDMAGTVGDAAGRADDALGRARS